MKMNGNVGLYPVYKERRLRRSNWTLGGTKQDLTPPNPSQSILLLSLYILYIHSSPPSQNHTMVFVQRLSMVLLDSNTYKNRW